MPGVEILSSSEVASEFAFNWIAFWITFGVLLFVCAVISIWSVITERCEWPIIPALLFFGISIGILLGILFGDLSETPISYETHYKVTIDESVLMNEFLEKYEILDQEGKIYTVRLKSINE